MTTCKDSITSINNQNGESPFVLQHGTGTEEISNGLQSDSESPSSGLPQLLDPASSVDIRIRAQQVITKDNVPVTINGVYFFKVDNVADAIIKLQSYSYALSQYAHTSLRDVIGQMSLGQLLVKREAIGKAIADNLGKHIEGWGLEVTGIRIQDINLPEDL